MSAIATDALCQSVDHHWPGCRRKAGCCLIPSPGITFSLYLAGLGMLFALLVTGIGFLVFLLYSRLYADGFCTSCGSKFEAAKKMNPDVLYEVEK